MLRWQRINIQQRIEFHRICSDMCLSEKGKLALKARAGISKRWYSQSLVAAFDALCIFISMYLYLVQLKELEFWMGGSYVRCPVYLYSYLYLYLAQLKELTFWMVGNCVRCPFGQMDITHLPPNLPPFLTFARGSECHHIASSSSQNVIISYRHPINNCHFLISTQYSTFSGQWMIIRALKS